MILCDVGNSFFHFYKEGRIWKEPVKKRPSISDTIEQLVYISVNEKSEKKLKFYRPDAINIGRFLELDTLYKGLGADRYAACMAIEDGVIIDAGSAITVDIMQKSIHLGGYILPGLNAYQKCFTSISKVLDRDINPNINLSSLPQETGDAVSFGTIKSIILTLESSIKNKKAYFTGGDGKFFSKFFHNAVYDETLVFKGMIKTVQKINKGAQ